MEKISIVFGILTAGTALAQASTSTYFPYRVGARWEYEVNRILTCVNKQDPSKSYADTISGSLSQEVVAARTRDDQGRTLYKIKFVSIQNFYGETDEQEFIFFVRLENDSVYTSEDSTYQGVFSVEPASPGLGQTWVTEDLLLSEELRFEVVDEGVQAAGYADCLEIKGTSPPPAPYYKPECYRYWAPGVGMVLMIFREFYEDTDEKCETCITLKLTHFST